EGVLLAAIKARSEDVTQAPETVFDRVLEELSAVYDVLETRRLDPFHDDHLGVVARKR
ncbi:MAG: fibrillarin-like rRNA/tRNA 2'-O-methyltransferase, partial [Halobacteriota archaeon]